MSLAFIPMVFATGLVHAFHGNNAQSPTQCADGTMTLWMNNVDGKNPCELVQDVLRVCDTSYTLDFLPRAYSCDNQPGSRLAPCCCGSPTFALMSACWSCQHNITFDLVSTTFTAFEKSCETLPDPITTYEPSVQSSISVLHLPAWSQVEPLAGKWDFAGAWRNATPNPTTAAPVPTGYPVQINSTGISKGALAGAIVGAILGSTLLFMLAGYLFYRWWKKRHADEDEDEDDEKGYAGRVLGEPRHRRRLTGRSRRGSRGQLDLDGDDGSPRPSRWPSLPPHLHPTSFHSPSSRNSNLNPEINPAQPSGSRPNDYNPNRYPYYEEEPGGVTPFVANQPAVESQKSRGRRQSASLRVVNDHSHPLDEQGSRSPPAPQPALLAHAHSLSYRTGSGSPLGAFPLASHSNSTSTSNVHGHSNSVESARYQEDDAGVSLVIEHDEGGELGVHPVPPAYVDYRQGYSNDALKHPRRRTESDRAGSTSAHGCSAIGGSEHGQGGGTSDSGSATYIGSSDGPTRSPSFKVPSDPDNGPEREETDTVDAKTMTETNTVREPEHDDEPRDSANSADSEGAVTIEPSSSREHVERPGGPDRSNTTVTAANTATNPVSMERPAHTTAPAGVPLPRTDSSSSRVGSDDPAQSQQTESSSATWGWGRALGVFGLASAPAAGSSPQSAS